MNFAINVTAAKCSGFVCHCCHVTECFVSADYPAAGNQATAYESRVAIQQQIFWLEFWLENTLEFWLKIPYTILIKKSKR